MQRMFNKFQRTLFFERLRVQQRKNENMGIQKKNLDGGNKLIIGMHNLLYRFNPRSLYSLSNFFATQTHGLCFKCNGCCVNCLG